VRSLWAKIHDCRNKYSYTVLKKIGMLYIAFLLCLTTLTGCASGLRANDERFISLEFELNRVTSRIDRLESKIDMLSWSVSPAVLSRTVVETDPRREQLEKLVVDITAQVSHLKEQLADHGVQPQSKE
jgi:outer membrane murein-binding lipoprotein Lpp